MSSPCHAGRVSVLFSEPKIPQSQVWVRQNFCKLVSVLFSEPKIPQYFVTPIPLHRLSPFQCSSASRKFLNHNAYGARNLALCVSVLFSEPKIPQCLTYKFLSAFLARFSALQRAENSSMIRDCMRVTRRMAFQCSSASRKFLNVFFPCIPVRFRERFSALQRADNSSIRCDRARYQRSYKFQCSSASRKFLNYIAFVTIHVILLVSVLFSEPKIPQLNFPPAMNR